MKTFVKNTAVLFGLFFAVIPGRMLAQTVIWSDEFNQPNDATSPTSGTRTPDLEGGGGNSAAEKDHYFGRSKPSTNEVWDQPSTSLNEVEYTTYNSFSGTWIWAGEQHDDVPGNNSQELAVTWTGISINGVSNIKFRGLFGASPSGFATTDSLTVEYKIDGGSWIRGLHIAKSASGSSWSVDGNGDGIGDGTSFITKTFKELVFDVPSGGNSIQLRLRVKANMDEREWAADKFQLISCNLSPPAIAIAETSGNNDNDGTTCAGDQVGLSVGSFSSYLWSTGATSQSISPSPNSTTTYSVTVTQNGCTASNSVQITVNPNPSTNIVPTETSAGTNNDGTICSGASVSLNAGAAFSGYSWSPGGGSTQSINVNPTSTTTYNVTVTDSNGCTDTDSQMITVSEPAAQTLTTSDGPGPFCADGTERTMRMSDTQNGVNYQLKRDGVNVGSPLAGTGNLANFPTPQGLAGIYTVDATQAATGCTAAMNGSVEMVSPEGTVDAGADQTICQRGSVTLAGMLSGVSSAQWTASPSAGTFSPNNTTLTAMYTPPGNFSGPITLTLTTTGGSSACPAVFDAMVLTVLPEPDVQIDVTENTGGTPDDGVICEGTPATLDAGTFSSYTWSPGSASTPSITVSPAESGEYSVTVTDANGCTNEDSQQITVRPNPEITPIPDMTVPNGGTATFDIETDPSPIPIDWVVVADNIDSTNSDFEPEGTSDAVEATFSVKSSRAIGRATYNISVESDGCVTTTTAIVRVFPVDEGTPGEDPIFIPELLTPNGDGTNDEWIILLPGDRMPEEYSVILRDRTGCVVHEGSLAEHFDASKCANGVYYYLITDEKQGVTYKGGITIITTN